MNDPSWLPEPLPNAPPVVAPMLRGPIGLSLPSGAFLQLSYEDAQAVATQLDQHLARGMRKRGSGSPPPDDIGGTPVMLAA